MPPTIKSVNKIHDNELQGFLNDRRCGSEKGSFTHTSIANPCGAYNIPQSEMGIFWELYNKVVFVDKLDIHLTERISDREITPFKIDIDLRYYDSKLTRRYTTEDIYDICKLYMKQIEEWIVSPDGNEREFFVMEKTVPIYDTDRKGNKRSNDSGEFLVKDGIHIIAPNLTSCAYVQHAVRESVYKNVAPILGRHKFENTYPDIFDKAVIDTNNWQMYGSRKPEKEAYCVTSILNVYTDRVEIIPLSKYTNIELSGKLSMRSSDPDLYSMLKPSKEDSVRHMNDQYMAKKGTKRTISSKLKDKGKSRMRKHELELVYKYIACLNLDRAKSYGTWIEVGWCLHNLHNANNKLLLKWIEFSKKSISHADEAEESCSEYWENMCNDGLGIASLKLWAKQDNPVEYATIIQEDIYTYVMEACRTKKGTSYDVAKVIHAMYKDYFVCISVKDSLWYYYDDIRNCWRTDDRGIMLKSKISNEVYLEFKKIAQEKQNKSVEAGDDNGELGLKIMQVMSRLKDTSFKSNLMTELIELFYDREKSFLDKLDANNNLLGFTNGVYDLKKEEIRKGRPEDYVSLSTNIEYIQYDEDTVEIQDIYKMIETIFVIKAVREYVLTRLSSFLSGSTKDESFDIFSGGGGNGKSKIMELLERSIGDYGCKLPISLLTNKRAASNAATPELAATKGKRIATLQEPDSDTKLNVGLMKELTGGDTIQARALYREPFEFKPQFKLVLCCNDKPQLPEHDQGTWRRVRNTEFISAYRFNPVEESVLQFKIDENLSEKMDLWAEPFMSLLIHYNKIYKKAELRPPDEINEYTKEYRQSGNHFTDFNQASLEIVDDSDGEVTLLDAYRAYTMWYNANHADKNIKNRKELQAFMDQKFTSKKTGSKSKSYIGIKIIERNDGYDSFNPASFAHTDDTCLIDDLDQ